MINYFKRQEINDDKWNAALAASPNTLPYAATYYLDAVCPNWGALILDDYRAIMPLTQNTKIGISYLFQPYFAQQLGIFSAEKISDDLVKQFIQAIPSRFRFIEINLNSNNTCSLLPVGFKVTERINYEINLNKPFDELCKNFSDNINRNYKKALQHELSIIKNLPEHDFIVFCKSQSHTMPFNASLLVLLQQLIKTIISHNAGELTGVADKSGNLCAVNFFINDFQRITNLFPVSSKQGIENGAMTFMLINQLMQHSDSKTVFDLEGSMIAGVARFYRSFGADEKKYYHIRRNLLPWYLKWIKN